MDQPGRIVVGPGCRELRRALRPIEWVVLEDVALDARPDGAGAVVAPTSARRVAEHLGLTPGAVARALARLRAVGLLTHARQAGPAGRFGLSAYVLGPVPGLDVVDPVDAPEDARPRLAPPHLDAPRAVGAHMGGAEVPGDPGGGESARRSLDDAAAALAGAVDDVAAKGSARSPSAPAPARRRRRPASESVAQLSILDTADDTVLDTNPTPQP